jgi:hypothetical protein
MEKKAIPATKQSLRQSKPATRIAPMTESSLSLRQTRQRANKATTAADPSPTNITLVQTLVAGAVPVASSHLTSTKSLPNFLTSVLTGLNQPDLALLNAKQHLLRNSKFQTWLGSSVGKARVASAARATLVFAQEEAGTAVCISPHGLLLTCSHCVAESPEEMSDIKSKWLLFASGQIVSADCVAWDPKRDLALLQITAAQPEPQLAKPDAIPNPGNTTSASIHSFPFTPVAEVPPRLRAALVCIGHPGSEDLEVSTRGVQTGYDVLHISTGQFRGYDADQDLQDNSEIGALKHDCWTYWGHSGAPLVEQNTSRLIGIHSSWDETTGMRRGVPLEAIQQFLQQHTTN